MKDAQNGVESKDLGGSELFKQYQPTIHLLDKING